MAGRHLPQGYVETGRWSLKQAAPADILLAIVVGLSVPIALLILGSLLVGPDDSDVTIGGGTFIIGIVPGAVMGVVLHELVHGVFFLAFGGRPRFGFKPWTRLGHVFYAAAPGSYFTKLEYAASGLAPVVLLTVSLVIGPPGSRVPGSGVRGRGSGERETTASSLAGKQQAREKEDKGGQGKDGPAGAIAQGGNGR